MEHDLDSAMSAHVTQPACPHCGSKLVLEHSGSFDFWSCERGHGIAASVTEAYGRIQDDEIRAVWALAHRAGPGPLPSLFGGPHMARVTLAFDADEVRWGEPGDAASNGHADGTIELDVESGSEFIWFDNGELDQLPADLPNEGPSAEEQARIATIAEKFGEDYLAVLREHQPGQLTELLADQILARHPRVYAAADHMVRAVTPM